MKAQQDKSKALTRLRNALNKIPELIRQGFRSSDFKKWKRNTRIAIQNTFGEKSRHVTDFTEIRYSPSLYISGSGDGVFQDAYEGGLKSAAAVLESMIEEVDEYWDDPVSASEPVKRPPESDFRKIFLIHGRDEGVKETVARLLENWGLEPVILAEQASQGRTIIEKFETQSDVSYAIALLTPDDAGSLRDEADDLRLRARQNVIFELGYFIGRLGREKVCALTKGDVEIPSDYSGVVYVPLVDGDGWKFQLVKELKAAGFDVDANRVL